MARGVLQQAGMPDDLAPDSARTPGEPQGPDREDFAELPLWLAGAVALTAPIVYVLGTGRPFGTGATLALLGLVGVVLRIIALVREGRALWPRSRRRRRGVYR